MLCWPWEHYCGGTTGAFGRWVLKVVGMQPAPVFLPENPMIESSLGSP